MTMVLLLFLRRPSPPNLCLLLNDDNLPRCDWHFCGVLEVYKNKDNNVRSAKLLVGSRDGSPGSVLN